jgi:hypothetical protein
LAYSVVERPVVAVSIEVWRPGTSVAWFVTRSEAIGWLNRRFAAHGIESLDGLLVGDGSGKAVDALTWLVDAQSSLGSDQ